MEQERRSPSFFSLNISREHRVGAFNRIRGFDDRLPSLCLAELICVAAYW
jgi:hypothetical protein